MNQSGNKFKTEFDHQIKMVGEKFGQIIENGTLSRGAKKAVYGTAMVGGAAQLAGLIASAIQTGAVGAIAGVVGLEALLHKGWEKYFTRLSHGNTIKYSNRVIWFMLKLSEEKGCKLTDLQPHEFEAILDQSVIAVEELMRQKEFEYSKK
jgi:hypothetical protein